MELWMLPAGFVLFILIMLVSGFISVSRAMRKEAKQRIFEEPNTDRFRPFHKRPRQRTTSCSGPR